jgi:hypothetical protein
LAQVARVTVNVQVHRGFLLNVRVALMEVGLCLAAEVKTVVEEGGFWREEGKLRVEQV